jgi:Ferritin-like
MRKTEDDFDIRKDVERNLVVLQMVQRWAALLMLVARQEMEHLAIVCNLLNAVGGDLNFERPNFPQPAKRYPLHIPFLLEAFDVPALRRFIWFEKPENIKPSFAPDGYGQGYTRPKTARQLDLVAVPKTRYRSVQELYTKIAAAFQSLDPAEVFVGNPDRQVDGSQFFYRVTVESVTNQEQAAAAIALIIEQGEGIGAVPPDANGSHFQMFVQILRELEEAKRTIPHFKPALDVVKNPVLKQDPKNAGRGTIVKNMASRKGMQLFNEAYQLLLMMLRTWFSQFSLSQNYPQQAAEFYAAFFPLMTMVIRPLGEILTRMPAGVNRRNAGPSFELPAKILDRPDVRKWYLCKLDELEERCAAFRDCAPQRFKERLGFIRENIHATRLHFAQLWPESPIRTKVSHFPI